VAVIMTDCHLNFSNVIQEILITYSYLTIVIKHYRIYEILTKSYIYFQNFKMAVLFLCDAVFVKKTFEARLCSMYFW
jgi:hypothetical protein